MLNFDTIARTYFHLKVVIWQIAIHLLQFAALGGFILLFGFLAFNGSSQGAISSAGDGVAVATAVKNTVLGGTGGAFLTLTLNRLKWIGDSTWSFLTTLNGCLAGMVVVKYVHIEYS